MRLRRFAFLLTVVVMAAVVVAGCGSSGSDSTSSSPSSTESTGGSTDSTSAAEPATGEAIPLGAVSTCSGPLEGSLGSACPTIEAWAEDVNAAGGINGSPVELTVIDDGGSPSKALAAAKELVEQDKVIAFVGPYSEQDGAWQKYVESKGVPVLGGNNPSVSMLESPVFYPSGGQLPALVAGLAEEAKAAGHTKLGMVACAEIALCKQSIALFGGVAGKVVPGTELVYSAAVGATQPDFTAQCLASKEKGVEAAWLNLAGPTLQRLVDQCAQQGFEPLGLTSGGPVSPPLAKDPAFEGFTSTQTNLVATSEGTPGEKRFHEAIDQYTDLSEDETRWNSTMTQVWSGGLLFEAAAKAATLGPRSTSADVIKGLDSLKGETLEGFAPPLTFEKGKPHVVSCYFVEGVENGELTEPEGSEPKCLSKEALERFAALLG